LAVLRKAIEERSGANSPQGMQPDLECHDSKCTSPGTVAA
jgi:hypothetical protein